MMNKYEKLILEANKYEIEVIEKKFKSSAKGLCKGNKIGISSVIETISEKRCVLAEEIGHCKKTVGNILDIAMIDNKKQELIARKWAYERLVGIVDIINAYNNGVRDKYELIEYLEVTEEFLNEAIEYYKCKYGIYYQIDNYLIYFEPLGVMEMF